jgi:uroporphyrinogen decarboxylase
VNSREKVRKTVEFDSPGGVPRQAWILPWAETHYAQQVSLLRRMFPDDIVNAPVQYKKPQQVSGDRYSKGTYVDEWGCKFENLQEGVIGIVREPLIRSWADLAAFNPPAGIVDIDTEAINAFCRDTDKFVLAGTVVRPFERLGFIRTLEQALIDLLEQPPELSELLSRIHSLYLNEVDAWANTDVDAIALMDDWGTQTALMIKPDTWRKIFKPFYREYIQVAKWYDKKVFMHSDGCIMDIMPDLIEVGVDALNSQIHCMGVEELGKRFKGQITFWGEIDRQNLLPYGSREEVRAAVKAAWENLYDGGGVIAQCEFGPGAKPENVFEVFRAWDAVA